MSPVFQSLLLGLEISLAIALGAGLLAAVVIRPAKAFAAWADLPPEQQAVIFPRAHFQIAVYTPAALVLLSLLPKSGFYLDLIVGFFFLIGVLLIIVLPGAYAVTWIRAWRRLPPANEIRRGLPFFIAGAVGIQATLLWAIIKALYPR